MHFQVTDPAFPALFFAGAPEKVIFRKREKYSYFYNKPGAPEKGDLNKKEKKYIFHKKPAEPHLCSPSSLSTPLGPNKNVCVVSTIKDRLKKPS